ncbi:hypothetical protein [Methylomonas koyamae]|uniref:hypothetical protein n=1 Tax=Methylomonas koyamae TaxID=702114 RepID=UPI0028735B45|nr:hypothetical protein [Methylomonas koyamae]WNB75352.1 hypothetical protein RI210_19050 [Methylomonas koyamae]
MAKFGYPKSELGNSGWFGGLAGKLAEGYNYSGNPMGESYWFVLINVELNKIIEFMVWVLV